MMKFNSPSKLLSVAFFSVVIMTLEGCVFWVESPNDLEHFTREARARPAGRIEPLPEYKPYQSFVYEGSSLREPFRALTTEQVRDEASVAGPQGLDLAPDQNRLKEDLELFSVDDLKMVGSIRLADKTWALVKDPNAAIHRVKVGDHLGLDYGEVTALDGQGINIVEVISDGRGGWMNRSRYMELQQPLLGSEKD